MLGSQEYLAEKFVGELIEAYFVYRNLNRPIGGVNFIPGTPYSIRGFFLRNDSGKYEFNPPSPFKQVRDFDINKQFKIFKNFN